MGGGEMLFGSSLPVEDLIGKFVKPEWDKNELNHKTKTFRSKFDFPQQEWMPGEKGRHDP
jgi:hypothetical protein